ncbi:hypothetical protein PFISCL1PPCAC_9121, partial [Pristionchus fissidentatus]
RSLPAVAGYSTPLHRSMGATSSRPPLQGVEIAPDNVTFSCRSTRTATFIDVIVSNYTDQRCCYKVLCTSKYIFRVAPKTGFVPSCGSTSVRLIFRNRKVVNSTHHHFDVLIIFNDTVTDASEVFQSKSVKPDGVIRLPVAFTQLPAEAPEEANEAAAAPERFRFF